MRSLDRLRQSYDEESQVVIQEKRSPPRMLFSDTEILLEEVPVGTRVVFPNPPVEELANWRAAIRWAINHPEGCDPWHARLRPGRKVAIAIDDISLPLPPMRTPDVRQHMLEIVLQLLADSGVDDVHLVIANALHRRMTEAEMRRMVGSRIFEAYYPDRYTNHDAEEPGGIVELGTTDSGEKVRISRRASQAGLRWTLQRTPRALRQNVFHKVPAAYGLIACAAGRTELTHEKILQACRRQLFVKVRGQADILIAGIPYISPYNVNSILNPLLVQVMACGYFFNMNRGIPLVKKGGTLIVTHPCMDEFDPVQHPSYIEFFHRLLPETTDAMTLHMKYEREFAQNPSYVHLYRKGNAYHGAHPFYMWYWGENGRQHLGQIIAVGAENQHVPRLMGWERADTLAEAIDMARGRQGRSAEITLMHHPPMVMTEVTLQTREGVRQLPEHGGGPPSKPGIAAKE